MVSVVATWVFGFLNGVRHALEPDHVAAVSTLMASERSTASSVRYASFWGAGHATMLILFGGTLTILRAELSPTTNDLLELIVAVALVSLGARGVFQARSLGLLSSTLPPSPAPPSECHAEKTTAPSSRCASTMHTPPRAWRVAKLPFFVGLIHGLAGSGALAALVASHFATAGVALVFIAIYAAGAALGMAALAGIVGWPLAHFVRSRKAIAALVAASGVASFAVGIAWAAPIVIRMAGY